MSTFLTANFLSLLTFAAGVALGLVHFISLRTVTKLFMSGIHRRRAIYLQLLRMAFAIAVLVGFAHLGALALLTGTLGFLLGRAVVLKRARGET